MKTAIAIRHIAFEDLGSLAALLRARDYCLRYHEAGVDDPGDPALREADLLIVLGGPISANDERDFPFILEEISAIRERLAKQRPTLGICLGAQFIARALGANVYRARQLEIGWSKLVLSKAAATGPLASLRDAPVFHWHGETFDLPKGATHLAGTLTCMNQAFAVGRHALALQFHLEITSGIEPWLIAYCADLNAAGLSIPALREATAELAPELGARARQCIGAWLDGVESSD